MSTVSRSLPPTSPGMMSSSVWTLRDCVPRPVWPHVPSFRSSCFTRTAKLRHRVSSMTLGIIIECTCYKLGNDKFEDEFIACYPRTLRPTVPFGFLVSFPVMLNMALAGPDNRLWFRRSPHWLRCCHPGPERLHSGRAEFRSTDLAPARQSQASPS